jgi:putative ABC transport system permease protein
MGVRLTLGASSDSVTWLVVGQALRWCAGGVGIGLGCSWLGSRLAASLLAGLPAGDAMAWLAPAALLLAVTAVATWIPARAAGRVDPVSALRVDG